MCGTCGVFSNGFTPAPPLQSASTICRFCGGCPSIRASMTVRINVVLPDPVVPDSTPCGPSPPWFMSLMSSSSSSPVSARLPNGTRRLSGEVDVAARRPQRREIDRRRIIDPEVGQDVARPIEPGRALRRCPRTVRPPGTAPAPARTAPPPSATAGRRPRRTPTRRPPVGAQVSTSRGTASITPSSLTRNSRAPPASWQAGTPPRRSKNVHPATPAVVITEYQAPGSMSAITTVCGNGATGSRTAAWRATNAPARRTPSVNCAVANSCTDVYTIRAGPAASSCRLSPLCGNHFTQSHSAGSSVTTTSCR